MTQTEDTQILLTVRGLISSANYEAGRKLHDETAGSPRGIAAARALGDLTHKVFLPIPGAGDMGGAKDNEVLFLDVWEHPDGLAKFFATQEVIDQGAKLFKQKDPTVWMPARGAFSFHIEAPANRSERYVGMIRVPVRSPEQAIETFRNNVLKRRRDARRRGQISHALYFRMMPPTEPGANAELLGLDLWFDKAGMMEHYQGEMEAFSGILAGAPITSLWGQPTTAWSEW